MEAEQSARECPPKQVLVRHRFSADLIAVRSVVQATLEDLHSLLPDAPRRGEAELILAEVLNNVVEHAYHGMAPGMVELSAEPCPNGIRFVITDSGRPMPNATLPAGVPADLNCAVDDLPEGGFGWTIIRQLAQDLQYQRKDGKNYTSFQIVT